MLFFSEFQIFQQKWRNSKTLNFQLEHGIRYRKNEKLMNLNHLQDSCNAYVVANNRSLSPRLMWKPFIEELFKEIGGFDSNQKVFVPSLNYLKNISYFIASMDARDLGKMAFFSKILNSCHCFAIFKKLTCGGRWWSTQFHWARESWDIRWRDWQNMEDIVKIL